MTASRNHISVCICTYQRPDMLAHLLEKLRNQNTGGLFDYSLVVVDNDLLRSAQEIVYEARNRSSFDIAYYCEPERNIALARNKAVENAKGNFLAIIDDDEYPESDWLLTLYQACSKYHASGILGSVKPALPESTPRWVIRGKFHEKGGPKTGQILKWQDTRTSNALLRKAVFDNPGDWFRRELGRGGEDVDFFMRAMAKGHVFVWCDEAPVYETIPPERCTRTYLLKRALLRGKMTLGCSSFGLSHLAKSAVAIPVYTLLLPFSLLAGQHHFVKLLTKQAEHLGRFLALLGLDVVREYYVSK
jgi:succinoglycan biosynthesis protein ExoM